MLNFWIIGACIGSALTNQFPWIWAALPGLALLAYKDQRRKLILPFSRGPNKFARTFVSLTLSVAVGFAAAHHVYSSHSAKQGETKSSKWTCQETARPQLEVVTRSSAELSWSLQLARSNSLSRSFCELRSQLRGIVNRQFPRQGTLIMSLLLGEKEFNGQDQMDIFRRLGILHLLVVSGFHVTLVAGVLSHLLKLVTWPFSVLGILHGRGSLQLLGLQTGLLIMAVWVYCMVVGFSAATQRSFILFVLSILTRGGFLNTSYAQRSWLGLSLQALIFPKDFASKGSVLSWAAYLIISLPRARGGIVKEGFFLPFASQLAISLTVYALFGEISFAGLLANFLLGPIFSAIITHSLYLLFFGFVLSWNSTLPDSLLDHLMQILSHLSSLTVMFPWLYLQRMEIPIWQTWIFLQITGLYLAQLNKARPHEI